MQVGILPDNSARAGMRPCIIGRIILRGAVSEMVHSSSRTLRECRHSHSSQTSAVACLVGWRAWCLACWVQCGVWQIAAGARCVRA